MAIAEGHQFVNIHGKPMTVYAGSGKAPPKRKEVGEPYAMSLGFVVTGWSAKQLEEAQKKHDAAEARAVADAKKLNPAPFDAEAHMRTHNGHRINTRKYELRESAMDCKALAERQGFRGVQIIEKTKNVPKEK